MTNIKSVAQNKKVKSSRKNTSFSIPITLKANKQKLERIESNPTGSLDYLKTLNVGGIEESGGNDSISIVYGYTIDITPDMARDIISVSGSYHDILRTSRFVTVEHYANEMKLNRWYSSSNISLGFDEQDSAWAALDGLTRLNAVILSGKTIRFPIRETHTFKTRNMHDIYANFDNGRLRKTTDASSCYGVTAKTGQINRNMGAIHRAARFVELGFNTTSARQSVKHTRRNAAECLLYEKETLSLYNLIRQSPYGGRFSAKGNFIGPCMAIMKDNPRLGYKFAKAIISGDGFTNKDPRKFIHMLFTDDKQYKSKTIQQTMNAIFSCWNFWMDGTKIRTNNKPTAYQMPLTVDRVDLVRQQKDAFDSYDKNFGDIDYSKLK